MRQNCTSGTSRSAVPATKKRPDNIDSLLKYCACHAKRKQLDACHKTQHKHAICREIYLPQVMRQTLLNTAHRHGLGTSLRTVATGCGWLQRLVNTKTTLSEHDSNLQTSRVKREPFATHSGKIKTRGVPHGIPIQQKNQEQDCRQTIKCAASLIDHPRLPFRSISVNL